MPWKCGALREPETSLFQIILPEAFQIGFHPLGRLRPPLGRQRLRLGFIWLPFGRPRSPLAMSWLFFGRPKALLVHPLAVSRPLVSRALAGLGLPLPTLAAQGHIETGTGDTFSPPGLASEITLRQFACDA